MRRWILFAIVAPVCFAQSRVPAQQQGLNLVLGWLSANTETILVATGHSRGHQVGASPFRTSNS